MLPKKGAVILSCLEKSFCSENLLQFVLNDLVVVVPKELHQGPNVHN